MAKGNDNLPIYIVIGLMAFMIWGQGTAEPATIIPEGVDFCSVVDMNY